MARTRILWSPRAEADGRGIRAHIAQDAPRRAVAFEKRLLAAVNRLKGLPYLGSVLEDADDPDLRVLPFRNYRVIYRVALPFVRILKVEHGSRRLRLDQLDQE